MSGNEVIVSIEELSAQQTLKKVAENSDPDQTPAAEAISEIHHKKVTVVKQNEKVNSKINKLQKSVEESEERSRLRKLKPKIQKVPTVLRDRNNFKKYFEPRAVSIGPIHHGNPKLNQAEEHKSKLATEFIKESRKTTEELYDVIRRNIQVLKGLFHEEVIQGYDEESLSWILFLDGCSTLQFIHSFGKEEMRDEFKIKVDQLVFAQHDLLLLENQIPFEVLRLLMNCNKDKYWKSIKEFICINVMAPEDCKPNLDHFHLDKLDPTHLLELLQRVVLLPNSNSTRTPAPCQSISRTFSCIRGLKSPCSANNKQGRTKPPSFRNIQELRAAGIDLKPSKQHCSLKDVTFNSLCFSGKLQLPPLIVDDSMGPKFLNLIAYELCPDNFRTNYEVTSYICFMDSLIDHQEDVKELRSAKILYNLLGSDEEVASLFNEIATDLVPNPAIYAGVKTKIQNHYDQKWTTWMAEVYKTHFSTPWSIMAFTAALLALFLSGVQTWYTINPVD